MASRTSWTYIDVPAKWWHYTLLRVGDHHMNKLYLLVCTLPPSDFPFFFAIAENRILAVDDTNRMKMRILQFSREADIMMSAIISVRSSFFIATRRSPTSSSSDWSVIGWLYRIRAVFTDRSFLARGTKATISQWRQLGQSANGVNWDNQPMAAIGTIN